MYKILNREREMNIFIKSIVFLFLLCNVFQSPAHGQEDNPSGLGWGLRGGLSLSPDQVVLCTQYSLGKKFQVVRVVPSVDLGFGDNVTTVDINGDFLLKINLPDVNFGLYGGGGPTLAFWDYEGGSDWELGLSLVVGTQVPIFERNATNLEARIGIGDVPDFRLLLAFIL
jgi:hypothetical protein